MNKQKIKVLYLFGNRIGRAMELIRKGELPDSSLIGFNHLAEFDIDADYYDLAYRPNRGFKRVYSALINQLKDFLVIFKIRKYDAVFLAFSLKIVFILKVLLRFKKPKVFFYNINLRSVLRNNKRKKIKFWLIKQAIKNLDATICPSVSQIENLVSEGIDARKLFFIPTGIDLEFIKKNKASIEPTAEKFILSVGKDPGRDYRTFIEAVKDLKIKVHIVAKNNLAGDIFISKNVQIEFLPYKELLKLYVNCLFVVVPTIDEDQLVYQSDCSGHTVILDAMACGKALIATERSTISHLIVDGQNGILVEPKNAGALKKAMQILIDDEALRRKMGELSAKNIERFSTRNFAEQLSVIIKSIIK